MEATKRARVNTLRIEHLRLGVRDTPAALDEASATE